MGGPLKFFGRFVLQIGSAMLASVVGGYLLTQFHFGPGSEPKGAPAAGEHALSAGQERALTREYLRAWREGAEMLAPVRPDPSLAGREVLTPREPPQTKEVAAPVERERGKPADFEAAVGPPTALDPPVLGASAAEEPAGLAGTMFSTVSVLSGKAANVTGETATFVIELPGRLLAAGSRLFERAPPPAPRRNYL